VPLAAGLRAAGPLLLFAPTIFVSAWLLFQVQPMFAKMALPLLGGSAVVWNTALVFFQAVLFLGYLYAHALGSRISLAGQVAIHLGLLALAFVALPVTIGEGWRDPPETAPIPWLIALLTVAVGLPFFAISANAPLLQNWFARTGHATARDPYFLYAASNLGSILALLVYPFLLEPNLRLVEQSSAWTGGFAVLTVLIAACAACTLRSKPTALPAASSAGAAPSIGWRLRLRWVALAFVPSGLLVAATSFMTTDLAAIPLLWIVPLLLYLLSFVFVFARKPMMSGRWTARIQAGLISLAAIVSAGAPNGATYVMLGLLLATLFATALVCHGELVRRRPAASDLTEFYVWMSLGGILGSAFCALLAPVLFDRVLEFAVLLVMAAMLRPSGSVAPAAAHPRPALSTAFAAREAGVPVLGAFALAPLAWYGGAGEIVVGATLVLCAFIAVVALGGMNRPAHFALCVAVLVGISFTLSSKSSEMTSLHSERSYFGMHRVFSIEQGRFVSLVHGSTIHGVQATAPELQREPLGYFHTDSGVGRIFAALDANGRTPRTVAVIGLGSGVLACHRKTGQAWTFFEIDAAVLSIARDTRYFRFLADCAPDARVAIGDGRLLIAREPAAKYDVLIVDVFSSDSIPLHLYTREALALYLDKLAPDGLLLFHISNRYMNLEPVMAALVRDMGGAARILRSQPPPDFPRKTMRWGSAWIAVAPRAETLAPLTDGFDEARPSAWGRWRPLAARPGLPAWTDDYSNLLDIIE
jgi:hypothetical protein